MWEYLDIVDAIWVTRGTFDNERDATSLRERDLMSVLPKPMDKGANTNDISKGSYKHCRYTFSFILIYPKGSRVIDIPSGVI